MPAIIPVLSAAARFIASKGVRKGIQKYGKKKAKEAQQEIAKREAAIKAKAEAARIEAERIEQELLTLKEENEKKRQYKNGPMMQVKNLLIASLVWV